MLYIYYILYINANAIYYIYIIYYILVFGSGSSACKYAAILASVLPPPLLSTIHPRPPLSTISPPRLPPLSTISPPPPPPLTLSSHRLLLVSTPALPLLLTSPSLLITMDLFHHPLS